MEASVKFWESQGDIDRLAKHWKYREKLPYDVCAILPHVLESRIIWDPAAGDDRVAEALRGVIPAPILSSDIKGYGSRVEKWNLVNGIWPPAREADTVLLLGVIQYLSDTELDGVLEMLKDRKVIVKTPCSPKDLYICKNSEEMGGEYESYYRSFITTMGILSRYHRLIMHGDVYPARLESVYGTKQKIIVGVPV